MPCSRGAGAIYRVRSDGSALELVAWGLRNPFGLAFGADGTLYATDNGPDDRGSRPVWGAPELLWRIEPGMWYGWPDFIGGVPIERFRPPNRPAPEPLLAEYPNQPPRPLARIDVHSSANGFDLAPDSFGYGGEAFIALFGDLAPGTGKVMNAVGSKLIRVDLNTGVIRDFAANRGLVNGPASRLGSGGLERPIAARFAPDGQSLYLVDFGVLLKQGEHDVPQAETGSLWRIVRE
jgi:glucose/arabinose dehydrogenase